MELINVSLSLRHELFLPSSDRVYHRSELEAENAEKELKVTNRWQRLNQLLKLNQITIFKLSTSFKFGLANSTFVNQVRICYWS